MRGMDEYSSLQSTLDIGLVFACHDFGGWGGGGCRILRETRNDLLEGEIRPSSFGQEPVDGGLFVGICNAASNGLITKKNLNM